MSIDISVSYKRSQGERRSGGEFLRKCVKSELWTNAVTHNPYKTMINHRKHEGLLYRQANGGFELKGRPRYHPDYF